MSETRWLSASGMMHRSYGFSYVTKCQRRFKDRLSLSTKSRERGWKRVLISQEKDDTIPKCSQCYRTVAESTKDGE